MWPITILRNVLQLLVEEKKEKEKKITEKTTNKDI